MIFDNFEGFKKIKNEKELSLEDIFSVLEKYQNEMGKMEYSENEGVKELIIDIRGKYKAKIRLTSEDIVIERILENGFDADELPTEEKGKKIELAQADRMIDQIYDLLKDYMDDGQISEHITSSKITLRMKESEKKGIFSTGSTFDIRDKDNKLLYSVVHKKFNRLFSIKSLECHMEVTSVSYDKIYEHTIDIQEKPFNVTSMKKDNTSDKLKFVSVGIGKKVKITADYTDNHYVIELNEIVIGAVDCLDPLTRNDYRIEVNNLKEMNFIVSCAVLIDTYMRKDIK